MKGYKLLLITVLVLTGCKNHRSMTEKISSYTLWLKPGDDLQLGIEQAAKDHHIEAGWIATAARHGRNFG